MMRLLAVGDQITAGDCHTDVRYECVNGMHAGAMKFDRAIPQQKMDTENWP
jgi:hypothetical protein